MSKGKTCGDCRYLDKNRYCNFLDFEPKPQMKGCANFEPKPTNGDLIRQGGDDALIDFADGIRRRMCHYCTFAKDKSCVDKTGDCWEGVRAWLNALAESEGEDE